MVFRDKNRVQFERRWGASTWVEARTHRLEAVFSLEGRPHHRIDSLDLSKEPSSASCSSYCSACIGVLCVRRGVGMGSLSVRPV